MRPVTGYLFGRGAREYLALGGTATAPGKLVFAGAGGAPLVGSTAIALRTWNHVALVRDGQSVAVYLNGNPAPEITGRVESAARQDAEQIFLGGRADKEATFEGKLDEVAIYNRALSPEEIRRYYELAGIPAGGTTEPAIKPALVNGLVAEFARIRGVGKCPNSGEFGYL